MEKQIDLSSWKRKEIFDFSDITSDSSRIVVADAPFRMYIAWIGRILFDLFTQTADMNIHGTHIPRIIVSPDQLQKTLPAVNLVGI